jgi:putative membrane protein
MYYGEGYMMGMHGFWWLFWALAVVAGIVLFWGSGRPSQSSARPRETALELLRRRLAGGEITPQDYETRKALLDRDG